MSKPTEQELHVALALAKQMREQGKDPHAIAKCLLNQHYRLGYLEEVLLAVERYLRSGMADDEHRRLVLSVEKARQAEDRNANKEPKDWGLS
jgi:hypothetical protein